MYCKLSNNQIVEVRDTLPKQVTFPDGRSTGNFDQLSPELQAEAGWFTLIEDQPTYDVRYQFLDVGSLSVSGTTVTRSWTVQTSSIAVLRSRVIDEVLFLLRAKLDSSQFTFNGQQFEFNEPLAQNCAQLQAAMSLPGAVFPSPFSWTQADGAEMPMDQATFLAFAGAVTTYKLGLYQTAKTKITEINALADSLAIATFDVEGGW